jgi:hypothetical protein
MMFEPCERNKFMSRMKSIFAVLVLAAIVGIVPQAHAVITVEVSIAGSSAQWQSLALGAYIAASAGTAHAHWTSASNAVNLVDSRTSPVNVDAGTLWVVWNCATSTCAPTKLWIFDKVDSVVGDRCFFAVPACTISASSSVFAAAGAQKIATNLWGADTNLPPTVQTLLTNGVLLGAAATDIRPEDAAFAMCRANSALGAGGVGTGDGLDGLGYNSHNAAGACPVGPLGPSGTKGVGTPIYSGLPGTNLVNPGADAANIVAFNITGNDPITGSTIPAWTVVNVGAAPIIFVNNRKNALANLTDASPAQLQQVFSGNNCNASAFGLPSGNINIFLREPTSGTMNTTEATVFRGPTVNGSGGNATIGISQESNIGGTANNPLNGGSGTCTGGGARYRGIGTGEVIAGVQNSNSIGSNCNFGFGSSGFVNPCLATGGVDGIAYTFFSYGNVNALKDSPNFGYITLNGVDPIFAAYGPQLSTGTPYDAGQNVTPGTIPGPADFPAACSGAFPCAENLIWTNGLSFPNVRNGSYPAWSLLRIVVATTGGQLANVKTLVADSQKNVVSAVPDYIPYATQTCTPTSTPYSCATKIIDPGLLVLRAHYQQKDGSGVAIGAGPIENFTKTGSSGFTEAGGDMGGEVFTCATQATCPNTATVYNSTTFKYTPQSQQVVQGFNGGGFQVRP